MVQLFKERWNIVHKIHRVFWDAWSEDCLNHLQHRPKWQKQKKNIEEGDVVLLKEDNIASMKWALARVVKVHTRSDQKVQAVR